MARWLGVAVATLVIAGCTATPPAKPPVTTAVGLPPPAAGHAAQSCVAINRIREARVIDDRTIDFYLSSREVLRNTLSTACPELGFERAFTYSTSLNQLCSVDIITVIVQGGGPRRGASCGLGPFVPYTPVPKK